MYLAYNGTSLFRGTANTIGYAFTGMPGALPTLPSSQYAKLSYGSNVAIFPRVNYQLNDLSGGSNLLRFRKGNFDSGTINISNPSSVKSLLNSIGTKLNITGVIDVLDETVEEEAKKGNKKSVEEIINLILNYGEKAVAIATGLGLIKSNANGLIGTDELNDGWGSTDLGGVDPNSLPEKKELSGTTGGTILGIKYENIAIGAGVGLLAYALAKK